MKKYSLLALVALLVSSAAYADDEAEKALENQSKIKRAQAVAIAQKEVPGTVVDSDIEKNKAGKIFWSIDIKPANGTEKEVHVDGQSGAVLSVENDDKD